MSKLLKSKFLLGVMSLAIMLAGVVAVSANTASAASCTITTTLRVGSKGPEVVCLQTALDNGLVGDGSFGPKTKARVIAWQASVGLSADGVFGAKSRAVWMGSSSVSFLPPGCTSASGYSSVTGGACYAVTSFPAGCTSSAGYSSTTGASCATGVVINTTYPAGCTSASGFSPTTGASCATGAVNQQTGPVSVSLSSDNPASGYIIANQATADLAHFTFTGTGTINSVVLQRTGISDQNTLSNVYLYDGNTRLTDGFSFNNVGQLTMNSLGIAVNGSKTISVKADVASVLNASSLGVTLIGYTAAGNAASTVSVKGNEMTYGSGNLAAVYLDSAVANGVVAQSVNAGTSAFAVWSHAVQVNTRAVWLKGANFRMTGSAPADALGNIKLYVDGVQVGSAATIGTITGSNYAMFDFASMPVSLSTGSHTIDVRADVVKGANYDVTVSLQQASDLVLYDGQVGVNIAVTKNSTTAYATSTGGKISIAPGSASVTVDTTFQTQTNITGGATNVVIGKYKVHGYGEDVKVSNLSVTPILTSACTAGTIFNGTGCTDSTTNGPAATKFATGNGLNNVTLFFNGSQVGSSTNWQSGAISFNLGSQMILPAGTDSYIEVRADLSTYVTASSSLPLSTNGANYTAGTVSADLTFVSGNAQGQTSHTSVDFPSASKIGKTLSIQTGTLSVSKNTGYANQSVGPNTANTKIGSYILQNVSTSEAVRVTSLAVNLTSSSGGTNYLTSVSGTPSGAPALTNFSNLRTSETSGSGSQPIQPSAQNTFSVDFTIAPNATKTIDIYADTSSEVTNNTFSTTLKVTSLGASSNVSISQNGTGTVVQGQVLTLAVGILNAVPSILSSTTTAAQYVAAANGGATNVTRATFNLASAGGSSTVTEMKFAVNVADLSVAATAGTLTAGAQTFTNTASAGFAVGDFVKVSGGTITTPAYGYIQSGQGTTSIVINITSAGVGTTGGGSTIALIPATATSVTVGGVSAPVVSGVAYLTGLNLVVPNGGSGLNQDVFTSYAEVGTNGTISGATSRLALVYVKYQSGSTTGTLCTTDYGTCLNTAGASATLPTTVGIPAPTMTVVGSSPTVTVAKPSSTLAVGNVAVLDVTVTANAKGNILLKSLTINYATSASTCLDGWTGATCSTGSAGGALVVVRDSNNALITTTNDAFAAGLSGTKLITFGSGYTISGSQVFHIYLPVTVVTGSGVQSASLTTSLPTGAAAFTWTDTAGGATVAQTGVGSITQTFPSALIPAYPSTFTSLIYN